jgi:hypothetical protein
VRRHALHYGCCALALAVGVPAHAQVDGDPPPPASSEAPAPTEESIPAGTEQRIVYTPLDFAQYAPRSALDMLNQVPGFNIQESFGQGRGLGQASGNVLINGERISSKSDSVTQRLSRIAAANVIRIEFVEGSTLNIPGLSGRVANIITSRSSQMRGQFEWNPQLATDYATMRWAAGRVSVTGDAGRVSYTVAADNSPFHGGTGGPNIFTFGSGLVEERFNRTQSVMHNPKLSTQLRIDGPGNSVGNLNGSYQWTWNRSQEDEFVLALPGAPALSREIRSTGKGQNYEIGGDFEFSLGPGRLKLIGLESYRQSDFSTQSATDPDTGAPRFGTRFTQDSRSGERIGRGEYKWQMLGGDWQWSGEAAFNRLDNVAGLSILNPAGEYIPIPFPSGTGGVREDRYESILSFGRPLTADLSMQISAGGEYSKIAQTGANALARTFLRPKGSLSLAWAPTDGLDLSLRIARRVGQLNFGDFLAEVNLSNDNVNLGNPQLRPQQSWEVELEAAKDIGPWGSLTLVLFDHRIEDYVTIVPLPGGGEAVGNIDSARVYGVRLNGTIQFDPIGFRGAKLDLNAQLRLSKLVDPVTGVERAFDRSQPRSINLQFRHDVPNSDWAWGSNFRTSKVEPYYRLAEIGLDYNLRTAFGLFVEHKDVFGLTVQARFNNLLDQKSVLDRTVFAGPRGSSPILFRENRRREIGRIVNFVVRGNF